MIFAPILIHTQAEFHRILSFIMHLFTSTCPFVLLFPSLTGMTYKFSVFICGSDPIPSSPLKAVDDPFCITNFSTLLDHSHKDINMLQYFPFKIKTKTLFGPLLSSASIPFLYIHYGKCHLCLLLPILFPVSLELIRVMFSLHYSTETTFGKVTDDFKVAKFNNQFLVLIFLIYPLHLKHRVTLSTQKHSLHLVSRTPHSISFLSTL